TAGFNTDGADDGEAGVAHELIFLVGQRLDGRDGDAVAGVHTHGIEVFDGTDDDAVVGAVAHDFHFVFLPAEQRFFDENFVHRREVNAALGDFFKFLDVVGNTAAGAAERKCRTNNEREAPDFFGDGARFVHVVRDTGNWNVETDGEHQVFERETVFAFMNGFRFGADHFDAVTFQRAVFV